MPRSICTIDGCDRLVNGQGLCGMHYIRNRKYGSPHGGLKNQAEPHVRFERFFTKGEPNECWDWFGKTERNGYGRFQIGGKGSPHIGAHRFSFERFCGAIPDGRLVLHSCDNRRCVNPNHLRVGTHKENTDDMMVRGRWKNPNPKVKD